MLEIALDVALEVAKRVCLSAASAASKTLSATLHEIETKESQGDALEARNTIEVGDDGSEGSQI